MMKPANQEMVVLFSFLDSLVAELQRLFPVPIVDSILDLFVSTFIDRDCRHGESNLHFYLFRDPGNQFV